MPVAISFNERAAKARPASTSIADRTTMDGHEPWRNPRGTLDGASMLFCHDFETTDQTSTVPQVAATSILERDDLQYLSLEPSPTTLALTTGGHSLALRNHLFHDKLLPNSVLDVRRYRPTFVHDVLMLPGTLAQLLGKESEMDIINRMTPAILRGFRSFIHPISKEPGLVVSHNSDAIVHGMIVFGQGKLGRSRIHKHYRRHNARRIKAEVVLETMIPVPRAVRPLSGMRWRRQPTTLLADVCVQMAIAPNLSTADFRTWTLEGFLSGAYYG